MILPVIMAGGAGSRLWPLSRGNRPKQFLPLVSCRSMLQETVFRLKGLQQHAPTLICNEEHRFITAEQIRQAQVINCKIILEPVGRNTAPAIALAALKAVEEGEDPILLVLAADHVIKNVNAFHDAIEKAKVQAEQGDMVTFGIVPTHAETGYGYIKRGAEASKNCFRVAEFVEKPALATAQEYLASGDYYWNSGMFMFKASRYLEELNAFRPDIYAACAEAIQEQTPDLDFIRVNKVAFEACPDESIDYAVMEKTERAVVVPLDAGWSDVGGFSALWDVADKDENGNVFDGDVVSVDTTNCLVLGDEKLVATVGVQDLVIVNTKDAVLVAHKDKAQDVKHIVNKLKADGRSEVTFHREVYRPWGKYDSVDSGERFQVKRITVKPGAKLSVQMHHHRAEHWIVVSGTAKVTIDETEQFVTENQSVYIPITAVHALENPGKVDLELIEVQSGSYLGEDDIVRFQDRYGRA
ncbi:mannose-1-phosphate guanylyltransferase/mannose-6-phosphate isomerase [Shewanella sp. JM162201]|uniref:mannose-1-phosphate guanylyltransferase n=1 Tax=Shewanella jiangmenensis TaxID=2837387 RepID=A0ABS5UY58_9GAMM|nr:mannose-1-phosphate guanylyltransferase/mannose-6-phosphate isomerase [Shewanella jiangmenensis]MBT1442995.1 mannose-1-phosphate guanylyltransferase/mannose-6-phosphate isomerase [Shewanella jiangmenensis]